MSVLLLTWVITIALLTIVIVLIWIVSRYIVKKQKNKKLKYKRFGYTTLGIGLLWTVLMFYGYFFGRWRCEVVEWEFHDNRLPAAFEGYRIVQISDFHLEGFDDNPAYLDTIVKLINQQDADLICFTGDMVSYNHEALSKYAGKLEQLKAHDGVVSILGNHDYGVYDKSLDSLLKEFDRQQLINLERDTLKWNLLLNENFTLYHNGDSIAIIGSENQACGFKQKVRRGDLTKAIQGTENKFQILLAHDPSQWDAEVVGKTQIPLTLSGHTHAMQFKVFGWTPCRWLFKRSDGAYREDKQQLYVNIGLGGLMPFRIGATPEITVISLHKQ